MWHALDAASAARKLIGAGVMGTIELAKLAMRQRAQPPAVTKRLCGESSASMER